MTHEQTEAYLRRINYTGSRELTGETLDAVIRAHITSVPFENLTCCEFQEVPSLDPQDLYVKVVENHRGGYCFELNTALHHLLMGMGFDAYPVSVRIVRNEGPLGPFVHKGVIVRTPDGKRWYCDVGFGGPGPRGAVEISEREQDIHGDTVRCQFLEYENVLIQSKKDDGWGNVFRFCLFPSEEVDFLPLNFYISGKPGQGFRARRMINLTLPNGSKALTNDHYTCRIDGQVVEERDVTDRQELKKLLREEFGLTVELPD